MGYIDGYGCAKPKTGDNRKALSRGDGYGATKEAFMNKTRSPHKGSEFHNQWEGTGFHEGNDNLKGPSDRG